MGNDARRTRPPRMPAIASSSASAAASRASTTSAWSTSARPASVSRTPRLLRSTSVAPAVFSRAAICWEIAGWVYESASAAAEKEPRSETALRTRSCLTSNITPAYRSQQKSEFELMTIAVDNRSSCIELPRGEPMTDKTLTIRPADPTDLAGPPPSRARQRLPADWRSARGRGRRRAVGRSSWTPAPRSPTRSARAASWSSCCASAPAGSRVRRADAVAPALTSFRAPPRRPVAAARPRPGARCGASMFARQPPYADARRADQPDEDADLAAHVHLVRQVARGRACRSAGTGSAAPRARPSAQQHERHRRRPPAADPGGLQPPPARSRRPRSGTG